MVIAITEKCVKYCALATQGKEGISYPTLTSIFINKLLAGRFPRDCYSLNVPFARFVNTKEHRLLLMAKKENNPWTLTTFYLHIGLVLI